MVTDQISDLLTRVRNAQRAGHPSVSVPASKTKERLLKVLVDEGYLAGVEPTKDADGKPQLKIHLRYGNDESPVIREVRRMSRPGRRVYVGHENIPSNRGGLGLVVVSTSRGMMSDRVARREKLGGELICSIF
ncbi:MAG: 30S ribosomal protein S8 [Bdellovibrionota bacterium]